MPRWRPTSFHWSTLLIGQPVARSMLSNKKLKQQSARATHPDVDTNVLQIRGTFDKCRILQGVSYTYMRTQVLTHTV